MALLTLHGIGKRYRQGEVEVERAEDVLLAPAVDVRSTAGGPVAYRRGFFSAQPVAVQVLRHRIDRSSAAAREGAPARLQARTRSRRSSGCRRASTCTRSKRWPATP